MNAVQWLLQDDTPAVAMLARRHLLDEDSDTRKMKSLRKRCNDYAPTAAILKRTNKAIAAGDYTKYTGAYWTFLILADLHADGRDKRIHKLAAHVLGTQLSNGGFSVSGKPSLEIACLTANVLRAAVHFGYGDQECVISGYKRLLARILSHGGVPCFVLDNVLQTSCKMTIPQTLRCLAVAPEFVPTADLTKTRDVLVKQLLDVHVFRYVRPDAKAFHVAVKKRPKGMRVREFKEQWLARHKVKRSELEAKPGWLNFGFPHSYNPDLLEAMLALTELGVEPTRAVNDALKHIESKRTREEFWKLDVSLNGKMLADVESTGRPSKWITLRAMQVLRHFGRLDP